MATSSRVRRVDLNPLPSPSSEQSIRLPRSTSGSEPQYLLLTLLGDYWFRRSEALPSAALLRLLSLFDVPDFAVRQALRRLAARGLLVPSRNGRTTSYALPPRTDAVIERRLSGVLDYARSSPEWDGVWTIVTFSIPSAEKFARHPLRSRLRGLGFAPLHDAVWVAPAPATAAAAALLDELEIADGFVFSSPEIPRSGTRRATSDVFDLGDLDERFRIFSERYDGLETDSLGPRDALRTRARLMTDWMALRADDPDLPAALLPSSWARPRARAAFVRVYDALALPAVAAFKDVVAEVDPDLAALASAHRASDRGD